MNHKVWKQQTIVRHHTIPESSGACPLSANRLRSGPIQKPAFYSMIKPVLLFLAVTALIALPVHADNWPNWRGPNHDGSTSAKNIPSSFSKT
jgi:hypothetical protein